VKSAETSAFDAIRREIADEYAQPHEKPWIVGFSGGKDNTLVTHLVVEHLLSVPRSERVRPVHIVANDTFVESPLVIGHVKEGLDEIRRASTAFDLPVVVATTKPKHGPDTGVQHSGQGRTYTENLRRRSCFDRPQRWRSALPHPLRGEDATSRSVGAMNRPGNSSPE